MIWEIVSILYAAKILYVLIVHYRKQGYKKTYDQVHTQLEISDDRDVFLSILTRPLTMYGEYLFVTVIAAYPIPWIVKNGPDVSEVLNWKFVGVALALFVVMVLYKAWLLSKYNNRFTYGPYPSEWQNETFSDGGKAGIALGIMLTGILLVALILGFFGLIS